MIMSDNQLEELVQRAIITRKNAYAPYSQFTVGAALLCKSGQIYTGCNVENSSYGLCICAERSAVVKAISEGETEFVALAIVADTKEPVLPCGACRQVLSEFNSDLRLIMATESGSRREKKLSALFPEPFMFE